MIVCFGEILVDMIGSEKEEGFSYGRYAGGAPFNVACAAHKCGGKSGFVGVVGDDIIGKYLKKFASSMELDRLKLDTVVNANTTLAFVELDSTGERSFCFYRKNTADYRLTEDLLKEADGANIVHLGSLMLSEKSGEDFADKLTAYVRQKGKKLSFDVNYREDIFPDARIAAEKYKRYADAADIVKYSEDELELFTGKKGLNGLKELAKDGKLICVTMGGKGSAYCLGDRFAVVPSIPVKVVDTTGAGDAFYGALLSRLDGKEIKLMTDEELYSAFRFANGAGAIATTAKGAIDSLPTEKEIFLRLN